MSLVNFDGIPGPTHNYAGLARGNLAAERNARTGREPARGCAAGTRQGARARGPRLRAGRAAAARASRHRTRCARSASPARDADIVARAATDAPQLLAACSSAAAMWTANAATVSPSADTARRPRAFHAGESREPLPSLARGADDDARAPRDLRRSGAFRRARPAARRAAVGRRGRRESHPVRAAPGARRRRALRLRPRGLWRRGPPRRSDSRRARRARRRPPSRAATASTRRARSSRSRIPRRSMPASSTTT